MAIPHVKLRWSVPRDFPHRGSSQDVEVYVPWPGWAQQRQLVVSDAHARVRAVPPGEYLHCETDNDGIWVYMRSRYA